MQVYCESQKNTFAIPSRTQAILCLRHPQSLFCSSWIFSQLHYLLEFQRILSQFIGKLTCGIYNTSQITGNQSSILLFVVRKDVIYISKRKCAHKMKNLCSLWAQSVSTLPSWALFTLGRFCGWLCPLVWRLPSHCNVFYHEAFSASCIIYGIFSHWLWHSQPSSCIICSAIDYGILSHQFIGELTGGVYTTSRITGKQSRVGCENIYCLFVWTTLTIHQ